MSVVAIIQARLDSRRLPGKVLKPLAGKPALQWIVEAAKTIPGVNQVVVATSEDENDTPIAEFCAGQGYDIFRGSKDDVLDRMYQAARYYKAETVLRLTADCPFLDPFVAGGVLRLFQRYPCDYACNTEPPSWPDGLDTEVFSFAALERSNQTVESAEEREHVTLHIRRNRDLFSVLNYRSQDSHLSTHRWTLDNEDDYIFLSAIAEQLDGLGRAPSYLDILNILERYPKIAGLRSDAARNEALEVSAYESKGFTRSLGRLSEAERYIPLGSQTFSKSRVQFPAGYAPLFLTHGQGGHVWDIDGNEYIDLICGLLSVSLGYCDSDVDDAIRAQLDNGITLSLATTLETQLAERLVEVIPCAEMVRFGKNGTDATSAAIRLARAFTGRERIIACGYHGWQDWYIGATTRNLGVPKSVQELTYKLPFNDIQVIKEKIATNGHEIAAIILEPASGTEPVPGYLEELRELTREAGIILIFDEIITGFRWSLGGAQSYYGVTPDLTACGKGMGNGMPISAVLGRADIMMMMEDIFYSGTFGGETLSLAASIAVIDKMKRENVTNKLWKTGGDLANRVNGLIDKCGLQDVVSLSGADPWKIISFKDHSSASKEAVKTRWMIEMLRGGVLIGGSHNICYAHTSEDIERITSAYDTALSRVAEELNGGNLEKNLEVPPIYPVFNVRG